MVTECALLSRDTLSVLCPLYSFLTKPTLLTSQTNCRFNYMPKGLSLKRIGQWRRYWARLSRSRILISILFSFQFCKYIWQIHYKHTYANKWISIVSPGKWSLHDAVSRTRNFYFFPYLVSVCLFIRFIKRVFLLFSVSASSIRMRSRPKITRSNEYKIKRLILRHYDKTTRPVKNDSTPVNVNVALSLYHILDTVSRPFIAHLTTWTHCI